MEAVAKMVKPPMVGHSSMKRHMASILAGGITYVDDNGAQHGFKPAFELDPKLAELIADQREYSDAIRSAYFEDLFLMLSGSETKTHVSAREIDEKTAERMATMSPVMSQFDIDVGQKIWENAQIILEASGRMPPKSPALKGLQVRPEYISILAQASKVSMMTSLERTLTFATSVSNAVQDPALLRIIKGEEAIRLYADWTALDPALINDEDEFEQIKSDVANKQSLQLEQSQQAQAAETAKNMSQAELGKGSLLDTMMSAAQA